MSWKLFCKANALPFAAGIVATIVGKKILKSKCVHDAAVRTVAKGLILKDEAQATLETIKEESQDIYAEAVAKKAQKEAESFTANEKEQPEETASEA